MIHTVCAAASSSYATPSFYVWNGPSVPFPASRRRPALVCVQTFFERMYMGKTSGLYGRAVDNFVRSLAGYAIVTYMLQVRFHGPSTCSF